MVQPIDTDFDMHQLAVRQLDDYDRCKPGTMFSEEITLGVSDAYRLQAGVYQLRLDRGEQLAGYKVGCTSPTIRAQLGIDHCIVGRLYVSECHASESVLSRGSFANLAVEGELAIVLSRAPVAGDFVPGFIPSCVSEIFPVVELHHHVSRGSQPSAGELIANNAIHAGFVRGDGVALHQVRDSADGSSLQILIDGKVVEVCEGSLLIETIRTSLEWLQAHLKEAGEELLPGQIVLTGSIPPLIPIADNSQVKVESLPFGSVEVSFVD